MNQYLTYLFEQFTLNSSSKEFVALVKEDLLSLRPLDLTKIYKPLTSSPLLFNQLNLLLAKGIIKYSPANCTIELSLANLMLHQRMFKLANFAHEQLDPGVAEFISEWMEQGLENGTGFPVMFEKKQLNKAFSFSPLQEQPITVNTQTQQSKKKVRSKSKIQTQSKPKQKQQPSQQQYNYHKLIYEYRSRTPLKLAEKSQQPQKELTGKSKPVRKTSKQLVDEPIASFESYMLNVEELTKLVQWGVCARRVNQRVGMKEKKVGLFEFGGFKDREQTMQKFFNLSQQLKYQRLQQFIAQTLSPDCLLVFNLIRKNPYLTQKELIKLTMLEVLQTRASLNQLIEKGLVYFYNENARTIVYKVADTQILERIYIDAIGRGMHNLALAAERIAELAGVSLGQEKVKAKLIQLQCEMQRLDDILIMFGW